MTPARRIAETSSAAVPVTPASGDAEGLDRRWSDPGISFLHQPFGGNAFVTKVAEIAARGTNRWEAGRGNWSRHYWHVD